MPRLFSLIAFSVVFLGSFAPRFAHASCGDWLQHSSPIQTLGVGADDGFAGADGPAAPSKPCRGPLCQQSPVGPQPWPANPTFERQHHDAAWMVLGISGNDDLKVEWFVADSDCARSGHKMGIERPPRTW